MHHKSTSNSSFTTWKTWHEHQKHTLRCFKPKRKGWEHPHFFIGLFPKLHLLFFDGYLFEAPTLLIWTHWRYPSSKNHVSVVKWFPNLSFTSRQVNFRWSSWSLRANTIYYSYFRNGINSSGKTIYFLLFVVVRLDLASRFSKTGASFPSLKKNKNTLKFWEFLARTMRRCWYSRRMVESICWRWHLQPWWIRREFRCESSNDQRQVEYFGGQGTTKTITERNRFLLYNKKNTNTLHCIQHLCEGGTAKCHGHWHSCSGYPMIQGKKQGYPMVKLGDGIFLFSKDFHTLNMGNAVSIWERIFMGWQTVFSSCSNEPLKVPLAEKHQNWWLVVDANCG